jgi:eukaryotic-like serine/threonine-protein kinase
VWLDRAGKRLGRLGSPGTYTGLRLSPDEKSVAVSSFDRKAGNADIWLFDLSRGVTSRFTFDPSYDTCPLWSPDGNSIVFNSLRDSTWNLYQKASSGVGKDEPLLKSSDNKFPSDWSRDGRFIAYTSISPKGDSDLWVLPLFGEAEPIPFLQTESTEFRGQFSPDGRWMAYTSDESGRSEVHVQPFPVPGRKVQVSMAGGSAPQWRRDGKELFYLAPDGKLMAVAVKTGTVFETGISKALFETGLPGYPWAEYAVSNDGRSFLMSLGETTPVPFTVVINWRAELKR